MHFHCTNKKNRPHVIISQFSRAKILCFGSSTIGSNNSTVTNLEMFHVGNAVFVSNSDILIDVLPNFFLVKSAIGKY